MLREGTCCSNKEPGRISCVQSDTTTSVMVLHHCHGTHTEQIDLSSALGVVTGCFFTRVLVKASFAIGVICGTGHSCFEVACVASG